MATSVTAKVPGSRGAMVRRVQRAASLLLAVLGLLLLLWMAASGWLQPDRLRDAVTSTGLNVHVAFFLFTVVATLFWVPLTVITVVGVALLDPFTTIVLTVAALLVSSTLTWSLGRSHGTGLVRAFLRRQEALALMVETSMRQRPFPSLVLLRALGTPNNMANLISAMIGVRPRIFYPSLVLGELTGIMTTAFLGDRVLEMILEGEIFANLKSPITMLGLLSAGATMGLVLWCQHQVRKQWRISQKLDAIKAEAPDERAGEQARASEETAARS